MAHQQFINVDMNPKLLEAVKNANRSLIIDLLDKRADIECHDPTSGSTPLMVAARVGAKNVVEYLIKRGVKACSRTILYYEVVVLLTQSLIHSPTHRC